MGRPSFQFYPDNYMNDAGVRRSSAASRGIWIDLLCLMHQGTPYGHLAGPSGPYPMKFLAKWCGEPLASFNRAIVELKNNGVFSVNYDSNLGTETLFSRRMVRDEYNRQVRGSGGVKSLSNPAVPRKKGILLAASEGILRTGDDDGEVVKSLKEVPSKAEILAWAQKTIGEYPAAVTLPGEPDEIIAGKCLELAEGDPHRLAEALNSMYKSHKKPSTSWAWFPVVLEQYLQPKRTIQRERRA